jgi:PIN domain nuclease of toxin-antitoxin system
MVIDTHVFLWYITDRPELPKDIKTLLASHPKDVYISSICFWELLLLTERGRISFGRTDPKIYLGENLIRSGFQEIGLNSEIAMLSRTLSFKHNDPADRFIAATASYLNLPLITYDQKLLQLPWLKTIS